MKFVFSIAFCCLLFSGVKVLAQTASSPQHKPNEIKEDAPVMFQFEPDYAAAQLKNREALLKKIRALDTLNISEKKRLRLIKALYKDLNSQKVQKAILVETQFEDDYEDEQ